MKYCSGCKQEKSLSEFYKNRGTGDGLSNWCKVCNAEYGQSHKEEIAEYQRDYHQSHKEGIAEYRRGYQQIHKTKIAVQRRTPAGREAQRRADKRAKEKYPEKIKAHRAVSNAIRDGRLIRPDTCEDCGEKKFVEGHHPDYEKMLEVDWLCKICHRSLHRELVKIV